MGLKYSYKYIKEKIIFYDCDDFLCDGDYDLVDCVDRL